MRFPISSERLTTAETLLGIMWLTICGINPIEMVKLWDGAVWELVDSGNEQFVSNGESSWPVWAFSKSDESSSSKVTLWDLAVWMGRVDVEKRESGWINLLINLFFGSIAVVLTFRGSEDGPAYFLSFQIKSDGWVLLTVFDCMKQISEGGIFHISIKRRLETGEYRSRVFNRKSNFSRDFTVSFPTSMLVIILAN